MVEAPQKIAMRIVLEVLEDHAKRGTAGALDALRRRDPLKARAITDMREFHMMTRMSFHVKHPSEFALIDTAIV